MGCSNLVQRIPVQHCADSEDQYLDKAYPRSCREIIMTEDVEMKDADPDVEVLGFGVLQFIKTAQSQHGLRHNDFTRYR